MPPSWMQHRLKRGFTYINQPSCACTESGNVVYTGRTGYQSQLKRYLSHSLLLV